MSVPLANLAVYMIGRTPIPGRRKEDVNHSETIERYVTVYHLLQSVRVAFLPRDVICEPICHLGLLPFLHYVGLLQRYTWYPFANRN